MIAQSSGIGKVKIRRYVQKDSDGVPHCYLRLEMASQLFNTTDRFYITGKNMELDGIEWDQIEEDEE